jgi:formate dehydrogenase assembly factor FdhD
MTTRLRMYSAKEHRIGEPAIDVAKVAGVTVIARARGSHYAIHSHPDRVAA